jgi:serine/threonine protein kinase
MPLVSGTKLGPYEIQSPLGAGGVGEVYRANDELLDRDVAVTVLPPVPCRMKTLAKLPQVCCGYFFFC